MNIIPMRYLVRDIRDPKLMENTVRHYRYGFEIPARPFSWVAMMPFHRLKLAWGVFIGKYDALDWEQDIPKGF